ncbi:MAG TPA: lipoyl(octanoyl) transferase LipB [Polyangia bacterium]|nr:lipoyl(octanoyl) transferase LipB [Polyangia bacterium]
MPFAPTAALQERLRADLLAGHGPETLLLLEHDPVITLGRSARPEHVHLPEPELARRGISLVQTGRGGDVTYHGPGQLVGYPIVRLRAGVVGHMTAMARAVAAVLAEQGVDARWRRESPGLWVGDAKICAFGVHVRQRVSIHGFALNVAPDLAAFELIVPCGIAGVRTTSLAALGIAPPPLPDLAARVAARLGAELGLALHDQDDQV